MMRHTWGAGLVLGLVILFAAGSAQAQKLHYRHSAFGPKRDFTRGIEIAKEVWEQAGHGDFQMDISYGSALMPTKEFLDGLKIGAFESATLCSSYYPGKLPLLRVMELPFFVPTDPKVMDEIEYDILKFPAIADMLHKRWNSMILFPIPLPAYEMMGNVRIATVADFKGKRVRMSGLTADVLRGVGAVTVNTAAPEGYEALQKHIIDMWGAPWSYGFADYHLDDVSKYATVGLHMNGAFCFEAMGLDAWARLPAALKDKLPEIRERVKREMWAAYAAKDASYVPSLAQRHIEVVDFPPSQREELVAQAQAVWNDWAASADKQGLPGTKLLDYAKSVIRKDTTR